MERKVGERFKYRDKTLEVLEDPDCNCFKCFFYTESVITCRKMKCADLICSEILRDNKRDVYFKEVKK